MTIVRTSNRKPHDATHLFHCLDWRVWDDERIAFLEELKTEYLIPSRRPGRRCLCKKCDCWNAVFSTVEFTHETRCFYCFADHEMLGTDEKVWRKVVE